MSQRLDPSVFKQFVADIPIEPPEVTPFRRGDADGNGVANLTDAVRLLGHLFSGGPAPGCPDAADVDDDGTLSLTDAVFTLNWLFRPGTDAPLPPGPTTCGADPNADDLDSCQYDGC